MTQKSPTLWDTNTAKSDGIAYSDATVAYSSTTASYSSATVGLDEFGKTAETWTLVPKTPSQWLPNVNAVTGYYVFDSASRAYDTTTDTYDGTASDLDTGNTNAPTAWQGL